MLEMLNARMPKIASANATSNLFSQVLTLSGLTLCLDSPVSHSFRCRRPIPQYNSGHWTLFELELLSCVRRVTHLWCSSLGWFLVFTFALELKMHKYPTKWIFNYASSGLFSFKLSNAAAAFTVCDVLLPWVFFPGLNTIRSTWTDLSLVLFFIMLHNLELLDSR